MRCDLRHFGAKEIQFLSDSKSLKIKGTSDLARWFLAFWWSEKTIFFLPITNSRVLSVSRILHCGFHHFGGLKNRFLYNEEILALKGTLDVAHWFSAFWLAANAICFCSKNPEYTWSCAVIFDIFGSWKGNFFPFRKTQISRGCRIFRGYFRLFFFCRQKARLLRNLESLQIKWTSDLAQWFPAFWRPDNVISLISRKPGV